MTRDRRKAILLTLLPVASVASLVVLIAGIRARIQSEAGVSGSAPTAIERAYESLVFGALVVFDLCSHFWFLSIPFLLISVYGLLTLWRQSRPVPPVGCRTTLSDGAETHPSHRFRVLFVLAGVTFVPVLFFIGLVHLVVPAGWGVIALFKALFELEYWFALSLVVHLTVYISAFALIGGVLERAIREIRDRSARLALHCVALFCVFSCSFLKVLTYDSIQGGGGTYNFWGACERLLEKRL